MLKRREHENACGTMLRMHIEEEAKLSIHKGPKVSSSLRYRRTCDPT